MSHPDVVYVVRPGERNEELRYSLRSLRNLPHGKVWIVGYCPHWVQNVGRIPVSGLKGHAQVKANLRAACEHPEVSESFYYFNDDFFVMRPMDSLPVMHRGPVERVIAERRMASSYLNALRKASEVLALHGITDPLLYELHAPLLVTKRGMLRVLDLIESPRWPERTLYGNLYRVGGTAYPNHKVRGAPRGRWQEWSFLSTNETTFAHAPVGAFIRSRFPEPSDFETPGVGQHQTPLPPELRPPVRYHAKRRAA